MKEMKEKKIQGEVARAVARLSGGAGSPGGHGVKLKVFTLPFILIRRLCFNTILFVHYVKNNTCIIRRQGR